MTTPCVVEREVSLQPCLTVLHALVVVQVNFLVLHASPQSLDEHVVQRSPAAIHTDRHAVLQQSARKRLARELTTLVGVEYFWLANRQRCEAKICLQLVAQSPTQNLPVEPVHHSHQVQPARFQWHVGDVGAPHLIRSHDLRRPVKAR